MLCTLVVKLEGPFEFFLWERCRIREESDPSSSQRATSLKDGPNTCGWPLVTMEMPTTYSDGATSLRKKSGQVFQCLDSLWLDGAHL